MQEVTPPRRRSFKLYGIVSGALAIAGTTAAILASVAPAIATNPDAQVMVFMVPLTLLVLVMLFEVARFALRGVALPAETAPRRTNRRYWSPGHNEG